MSDKEWVRLLLVKERYQDLLKEIIGDHKTIDEYLHRDTTRVMNDDQCWQNGYNRAAEQFRDRLAMIIAKHEQDQQ